MGYKEDYKEFLIFEKSFENFLMKLRNKKRIKIDYHFYEGRNSDYDFSFTGYRTKNGWHGIHYCYQKNSYYFGTRNLEFLSGLNTLNPAFAFRIPDRIKDAFLMVAQSKTKLILNKE